MVEDESAVRGLARTVLISLGYTVLEASRGAEALSALANHPAPVDSLLTDMVMPEMGGRDLAMLLLAENPNLKVLYMSGFPGTATRHQQTLGPSESFLQKPFTPGDLARKVRETLGVTAYLQADAAAS